ncbi:replication initiation protein [Sulfuricurvum sp.]|uniref:replication initiation protein n=1 Tax=Sulfuricurvum sp. TaxID=2025608 RepID=UPI002D6B7592|nr:replication initiation protein [Sulfuricurvum sp.]HZF70943.1 replication initiation protein [Sulfuricurvum sp.]
MNLTFTKHSAIIQISSTMSASARKVYNVLLFEAKREQRRNKDNLLKFYSVDIDHIKRYTAIQKTSHVIECIKELAGLQVAYNVLNKDKNKVWGTFALISNAEIENDIVMFKLPYAVVETFEKPKHYATIDMAIIKGLKSKYAINLYEFLEDYKGIKKITVQLPKLRELMGISDKQYPRYADFNKRVLSAAIEEVKEKTPYNVKATPIIKKRKVVALEFTFFYRDETVAAQKNLNKSKEFNEFRKHVFTFGKNLPLFVYNNQEVYVGFNEKREMVMLYHQADKGIKYYTNEEAKIIWNSMLASKEKIYEKILKLGEIEFSFK